MNEERVIDDEMAKGVPYVNVMVEDGELEEGEILEDGEIEPESNNLVLFLDLSMSAFFLKAFSFLLCFVRVLHAWRINKEKV